VIVQITPANSAKGLCWDFYTHPLSAVAALEQAAQACEGLFVLLFDS